MSREWVRSVMKKACKHQRCTSLKLSPTFSLSWVDTLYASASKRTSIELWALDHWTTFEHFMHMLWHCGLSENKKVIQLNYEWRVGMFYPAGCFSYPHFWNVERNAWKQYVVDMYLKMASVFRQRPVCSKLYVVRCVIKDCFDSWRGWF